MVDAERFVRTCAEKLVAHANEQLELAGDTVRIAYLPEPGYPKAELRPGEGGSLTIAIDMGDDPFITTRIHQPKRRP